MKIIASYMMFICLVISCEKQTETPTETPKINLSIDDKNYVVNNSLPKGDVRRYGVFPNKPVNQNNLGNIIRLAAKGVPITFPKGVYETNLVFNKISNINIVFQDAVFSGGINILNGSHTFKFDGNVTILDKLFIRKSSNIIFDNVTLMSDTLRNIYHKENRGVSIYVGSKNIEFNTLKITDTGGNSDRFYTYSAAALQIHGWNNNPQNITINTLEITNSARTALYVTGKDHKFKKVTITNFGIGSTKNMFGLEDAKPKEETEFTGLWMNKCDNCEVDSLSIDNTKLGATYSLRLGEGVYHEPSFIYNINFKNKAIGMTIKDDILTNILVKNEY